MVMMVPLKREGEEEKYRFGNPMKLTTIMSTPLQSAWNLIDDVQTLKKG